MPLKPWIVSASNSKRMREIKNQSVPFYEAENEAAFYGPKIDVQMKNVNGKEDTAFVFSALFILISFILIVYKSIKLRGK